jgi:site-specific DNA recombinase
MRVAIYVRVSTQRQAQTQTIEQQIERLRAHIEAQGWVLEPEHIYRDDGYSGAKLSRPGLDSLRDRAALAEFDLVLITEPDRLARNYVHQMVVIEELERRGIRIEFLDRPMSDDPHDRLLLQIRGAVAEYERTQISDRMRRGRLAKFRAGQLLPWTRPLYGYRVDPEHPRDPAGVRLDEAEATMVTQMFEWYLEPGASLYYVAKRLTDLELPTPRGKPRWNVATVRGILKNPAYTGTAYANRTRAAPAKKRKSALQPVGPGESWVPRSEEEWIAIPVPAVVTEEMFDRVQDKLSLNQQMSPRNNKVYNYLLRGLVSCGQCRLSAIGRTIHGEYHYYVCRGRTDALRAAQGQRCKARYAPAAQLDELVWQDLSAVLTQPNIIAHALERAHGGHWAPQELRARIGALKKATEQLERQQERLLEAYLADVVTLPELERKRQELAQKQEALRTQQAQLEATVTQRIELSQVAASIEAFCAQVRPVLEQATFAQRRQLVELLIDRVIVTDDKVEIRYVIPTHPDGPHVPFSHLRIDYLHPHSFLVQSDGPETCWLIGDQEPGFVFSAFPMSHQLNPAEVLQLGPPNPTQIECLPLFHRDGSDGCPAYAFPVEVIRAVHSQTVVPMTLAEPAHQLRTTKSSVSHDPNLRFARNQRRQPAQQRNLRSGVHHTSLAAVNAPDQRQRPAAIGNGDHHQLVIEPQRGAVDQQGQSLTAETCQQLSGDGLIVAPHVNPWVVQETPQSVCQTDHLPWQRKLAGNMRQMNTLCQKQTCHQPGQVMQSSDSFLGQPLAQLTHQCTMKLEAVLHNDSFSCGFGANNYTRVADGLQMLLTFKVIGS